MAERLYDGIKVNLTALIEELRTYFENEDFEVQVLREASRTTVQARKSNPIRNLAGNFLDVSIQITPGENGTLIDIGKQRWIDKATVGAAGFFFPPLIAVAGFGAYQQYLLSRETWNVVDRHMAKQSGDNHK
jgi:hypothetical protein